MSRYPSGKGQGRLVALPQRRPIPTRQPVRAEATDWAAWFCLGLGILCGVAAVYFALFFS